MSDSKQTVRIFISSPGDVAEERDGARRVIEGLQRLYPNARLQPVLWEELALPATASFQETIEHLLEREPIDIAVFILWSRLGSPLGPAITRKDGTPYRSGTEREFDVMLAAFEHTGRKRPVILAYVRDDDSGFTERLAKAAKPDRSDLIDQQQLVESFIVEQFHDAEGRNLRAYQTYSEPIGFTQRLRVHLRRAIDDLLEVDTVITWTEEPYRGLEVFDVDHAPIFHGRDEETCDVLQRLRDQQLAGCEFVVIVGASGSGKSSLARAGVAATLLQHKVDENAKWRVASLVPTIADKSLIHSLVGALATALPDLIDSDEAASRIEKGISENASLTVELTIAPAFAKADEPIRLLLILDQMEELWTDRHTTEEDRERFLAAVETLACSDHVAVLATLRSDFYHHAQESATLLRLKGKLGHFDLRAPDAASIHRLITEPARLSGVSFERNEQTGRSLDEVMLEDASHDSNALPLLEYTLAELYRQRDQDRRLMTYAAYVELGGVEGAIGKRAEETFASLSSDAQQALDEILPLLVSVDVAGEQAAVRRRAHVADLTSTPARDTLTELLIADRFLTTDREGEIPIASLAHEALLRSWDRIVGWINVNRENLRLRARVEQHQQRWEQQDRDDSLLLPEGLPLGEGRQLIEKASYLLTAPTTEYIHASITHRQSNLRRSHRVRTAVLSTIAALILVLMVGGIAAWQINEENKRKAALEQRVTAADGLVQRLLDADASGLKVAIDDLAPYRDLAREDLVAAYEDSDEKSKAKLHAALALVREDDSVLPFLKEQLLQVAPTQFGPAREQLDDRKSEFVADYWKITLDHDEDARRRFQAACVLASCDPSNQGWQDPKLAGFVADHLVGVLPSELVPWRDALRPVRKQLTSALGTIYRDKSRGEQVRSFATDILGDYLNDDIDRLFDLLMDAEPKQFAALFDRLANYGDEAIVKLDNEIQRDLEPTWDDPPLNPSWQEPSVDLVQKIEMADGMVAERFAFCQALPLDEFLSLADGLGQSGYRPTRLRSYSHEGTAQVAAAWTRDARDWRVETAESAESILEKDAAHRADGFDAIDVSGYLDDLDGKPAELYAGLWVKQQSDSEDARIYVGVPYEQHKEACGAVEDAGYKFQQSLNGFRGLDGKQIYCGVKIKAGGIGSWSCNQTASEFDGKLYLDKIHWDVDASQAAEPETTRQRNEKALADAEAKLDQDPDDLNERYARGKTYFYLDRNDEALNDMEHCVQQSPGFVPSYQFRAVLYARLGDTSAARADLEHFEERSSSPMVNAYLDVIISAYLGDDSEAISRLEALVDENQDNDGMLYDAACAYSIASGVHEGQDATKSKLYADRAVALLGQAIAAGYSYYSHILEDADLDPVRDHEGFVVLMKAENLDLRYAAVWNESTRLESKESHGLSPEEHLEQCSKLRDEGYRLSSLSAASIDDELVTASVWHRPLVPKEEREALARRQANAASALARLLHDKLFPALRVTDDPESLTQFVHRCREEGVTPLQLLACLKLADRNRMTLSGDSRQLEDRVVFGLMLALGEFSLDELPSDQQQFTVDLIAQWYGDDPSSTIHGASGWLLRRWDQDEPVREVDEVPRPYDPQRQWFTLAIDADPQTFYQTYVVIPPGEYSIGAPNDERDPDSIEALNRVRLTRPFAILDREITRGEYEASGHRISIDLYSPTLEHPMAALSWYDSVKFCRWLTRKAGFSEADQAYPDPSELSVSQYPLDPETDQPKNWPVRLAARGFRLPTEAEWEIATRAGMRTYYSFGGDETLLDKYAWYQSNSGRKTHVAREVRPNFLGLFDVHGNLYEWCHDWFGLYPLGGLRIDPLGSPSGLSRVSRGGSKGFTAAECWTAYRDSHLPAGRNSGSGLRVAVVPFVPAERSAERGGPGEAGSGTEQSATVEADP